MIRRNEVFTMKIIAGNWKMNGTPSANVTLLEAIKDTVTVGEDKVIVFPPFCPSPTPNAFKKELVLPGGTKRTSCRKWRLYR